MNLSLEPELIEEIKIQAFWEARSVSNIARDLFREYLDRHVKVKVKKSKQATKANRPSMAIAELRDLADDYTPAPEMPHLSAEAKKAREALDSLKMKTN